MQILTKIIELKWLKDRFQVKVYKRQGSTYIDKNFSSEEDITVINTYVHSNRAPRYMNQ